MVMFCQQQEERLTECKAHENELEWRETETCRKLLPSDVSFDFEVFKVKTLNEIIQKGKLRDEWIYLFIYVKMISKCLLS